MSGAEAAIWIGFATFVATILGPVLAVEVSRKRDFQRARYQRKFEIFRTLMRLRRTPIAADFVAALNLIEVEFHDVAPVIQVWRRFLDNVNSPPAGDDARARVEFEKRKKLIDQMLTAMGNDLGVSIANIPISEGGYSPMAHGTLEDEATIIRKFVVDLALDRRAIPVEIRSLEAPESTRD